MAVAQLWKRPELTDQPDLKKLNDRLHELRLDAGLPSARTIRDRIGMDAQGYWIVNHQAVLDTFQKSDLPQLGRLELIVAVLAENSRRDDVNGEVDRFKDLWRQAVKEAVKQASVRPPTDARASASAGEASGVGGPFEGLGKWGAEDTNGQVAEESPAGPEAPEDAHQTTRRFNYAEESLKGLIINAAQALWDDKDALKLFLGVVRRSAGFVKLADAAEERRPANATFYGVESREFEVDYSPARHELITLHRCLDRHRLTLKWSFTDVAELTGISSDAWIRWYTRRELPKREALVTFSHVAALKLEEHVLLLGLWDAAHDALSVKSRSDALPSGISFDEAWNMRDPAAPRIWALAGVGGNGGDDLTVYGPDLANGVVPAFVVAGPAGSGRSTVLMNMARSLLAAGTRLVLAAPRPSPLRGLADRDGVVACFVEEDIEHGLLEEAMSVVSTGEPVVFVMDDAERLGNCDALRQLKNLLRHGFDEGVGVIVGGDDEKLRVDVPWLNSVKKAHRGLLLSPQHWRAGDLIGVKTTDAIIGNSVNPGRGWLHLGDGKLFPVVVPQ